LRREVLAANEKEERGRVNKSLLTIFHLHLSFITFDSGSEFRAYRAYDENVRLVSFLMVHVTEAKIA